MEHKQVPLPENCDLLKHLSKPREYFDRIISSDFNKLWKESIHLVLEKKYHTTGELKFHLELFSKKYSINDNIVYPQK
ncbi:hypothetical protein WA026_004687 [Henosepilachna vigintioctopunctata]|uniref:Uncharacterized protein n=1 Tax=Henosepilachna vigintioctopunctata TaxID=420089 RepID=A0AAW1VBK1_9CUCU